MADLGLSPETWDEAGGGGADPSDGGVPVLVIPTDEERAIARSVIAEVAA